MVDLVKIRKKAKKKDEEAESAVSQSTPVADGGPAVAPAPAPVELEPQPKAETNAEGGGATPAATKLEKFKETAGKRREQTIAQVEEQAAPTSTLELLTFVIAGESYAVDIEHIMEIVTPRTLTRIPNADPSIVGIMSLRGTIVTLVDVRRKLRHASASRETPDTRIVVVDLHGEMLGFAVDRVNRVIKTTLADIEPHPVVHVSEQDVAIRGVFRAGNALTILLDLDKLLDSRALAAPLA
ncbi:MAG TPA: chemotaxis protein CheW [Thermoanaerobaculia bacterium]